MVHQLLLFYAGYHVESDRDSYTFKRVNSTGVLLASLTRQHVTKFTKDAQQAIIKELDAENWKFRGSMMSIFSGKLNHIFKSSTLDAGLMYSLNTGKWGMKNYLSKSGVAQVLNRHNASSILSHLRRSNTPIDKTNKLILPRELHLSAWGRMCLCETPEGGAIGSVRNLAIYTEITLHIPDAFIRELLTSTTSTSTTISTSTSTTTPFAITDVIPFPIPPLLFDPSRFVNHVKLVLNGDIVGFTLYPQRVFDQLISLRRAGIIHPHVSIYYQYLRIQVVTDAGRVTRPCLIVTDGKLVLGECPELLHQLMHHTHPSHTQHDIPLYTSSSFTPPTTSWWSELSTTTSEHPCCIDYLDANEGEQSMICSSIAALYEMDPVERRNYTHCEIDPAGILGAIAAKIVFINHNQSPRNTYQSAMEKQRISVNSRNPNCVPLDTSSNCLTYGQVPLVTTNAYEATHQRKFLGGMNVRVALMCYTGFNQEDSILVNKSACDRGLFNSTFYPTYRSEEKRNQLTGEEEKFMQVNPHKNVKCVKNGSYSHLGPDGLARKNAMIRGGDVVIGKAMVIKTEGTLEPVYCDQSVTHKHTEDGYVHQVYMGANSDGYNVAKVQTRNYRTTEVGDKFSSCHGQKGTTGFVLQQEDMPYNWNGECPDIIINPHAIPSRMTIAQFHESLESTLCGLLGMTGDGSPFGTMSTTCIGDMLEKVFHMNRFGNELLYNGMTGRALEADIFCTTTHYQKLKHCSTDKKHARSTGPKSMLTRQPTDGRARDGGLRLGEMEKHCSIAHGLSAFTKERMNNMSDPFLLTIPSRTGLICAVNKDAGILNTFSEEDPTSYEKVQITYSFKLLMQELMTLGIATRIFTE
jgi:DNA-directed RNA polymerase II subunit RPB2